MTVIDAKIAECDTMGVTEQMNEVYPDGMSRQEYERALATRMQARRVACMILRLFPEIIKERRREAA